MRPKSVAEEEEKKRTKDDDDYPSDDDDMFPPPPPPPLPPPTDKSPPPPPPTLFDNNYLRSGKGSPPSHTPVTPPVTPMFTPHMARPHLLGLAPCIIIYIYIYICALLSSRAEQPLRSRTTLLSSARAAPAPPLWAPPRKTRDGSAQQMDARGEACTCCGECVATAVTVSVAIVFAFLACYLLRRHKGRRLCRARIRKRTWEVSVRAPAPGHELLPPAACAAVMRGSRVASPCTSPLSQCTSPQMHARPLSALLPLVGKKVEGS